MTASNNNNDNDNNDDNKKKQKRQRRRSVFAEADEREEKLKIAKRKADFDRKNALTAENAEDELTHQLLVKAMREMFDKTDRLQGGSFIHGSMSTLNAGMWKGAISSRKK